jgi:hypothetical protein
MRDQLKFGSIEGLRIQRGLDDPFRTLLGKRTMIPNWDIDYVLTYGIQVTSISTMSPNFPAHSDHLGIIFDIDIASYFPSTYSDLAPTCPRLLNIRKPMFGDKIHQIC